MGGWAPVLLMDQNGLAKIVSAEKTSIARGYRKVMSTSSGSLTAALEMDSNTK